MGIKWEGNQEIVFELNYSVDGMQWNQWQQLERGEGNSPVGTYITDYIVFPKETKYEFNRVRKSFYTPPDFHGSGSGWA